LLIVELVGPPCCDEFFQVTHEERVNRDALRGNDAGQLPRDGSAHQGIHSPSLQRGGGGVWCFGRHAHHAEWCFATRVLRHKDGLRRDIKDRRYPLFPDAESCVHGGACSFLH